MTDILASSGSFPTTNLYTGRPFFRSDLGLWCYYDSTQWLTAEEYSINNAVEATASAADNYQIGIIRTDYNPYITRVTFNHFVSTTNDGSNYWNFAVQGLNAAQSATTSVATANTSADSPDTWYINEEGSPTATPANDVHYRINCTKTSSPGNLTIYGATLYYRLIVT